MTKLKNDFDAVQKPAPGEFTGAVSAFWCPLEHMADLLRRGADIDEQDQHGSTALMTSTELMQTEVVRMLLDNGASIDIKDNFGETALVRAKNWGCHDIAGMIEAEIEKRQQVVKKEAELAEREQLRQAEVVKRQRLLQVSAKRMHLTLKS